jgi:hypothetical protein
VETGAKEIFETLDPLLGFGLFTRDHQFVQPPLPSTRLHQGQRPWTRNSGASLERAELGAATTGGVICVRDDGVWVCDFGRELSGAFSLEKSFDLADVEMGGGGVVFDLIAVGEGDEVAEGGVVLEIAGQEDQGSERFWAAYRGVCYGGCSAIRLGLLRSRLHTGIGAGRGLVG